MSGTFAPLLIFAKHRPRDYGEKLAVAWKTLRDNPWLAFLPMYAQTIDALDRAIVDGLRKYKKSPCYGLSPADVMRHPSFIRTMSKTHGVPRHWYPQQEELFRSEARERFFVGGNRGGKTMCGALEMVFWMKGEHPYRKDVPEPPNLGWACCPDLQVAKAVNIPMLKWALGKSGPSNYKYRVADFRFEVYTESNAPSMIQIKSFDSPSEKFGGADVDLIWNDEPCPKPIYVEESMRRGENPLNFLWTLTPVVGPNSAWLHIEKYREWLDAGRPKKMHFIDMTMDDNIFLPPSEIQEAKDALKNNPDEYNVRIKGNWSSLGGFLYPNLDPDVHLVDDFEIPGVHRDPRGTEVPWTLYRGIDPGMRNDFACVWVAVDPTGLAFLYREFLQSDLSIPEQCQAIIGRQAPRERFRWTTIDIAAAARDYSTGIPRSAVYIKNGVDVICASNRLNVADAGGQIGQVKEWFAWSKDEAGNFRREPRLRFFRSCEALWRQNRNASWKAERNKSGESLREQATKHDSDGADALRYLLCAFNGPAFASRSDVPILYQSDEKTGY